MNCLSLLWKDIPEFVKYLIRERTAQLNKVGSQIFSNYNDVLIENIKVDRITIDDGTVKYRVFFKNSYWSYNGSQILELENAPHWKASFNY